MSPSYDHPPNPKAVNQGLNLNRMENQDSLKMVLLNSSCEADPAYGTAEAFGLNAKFVLGI